MLKDFFFQRMESLGLALTFDEVRLKTGYSLMMPDDVSLETRFSRNITLKIPIVSAAMDTVTEHKTAIRLAQLGGLGVIHRNLSPERQEAEVSRVKHYLNGLIRKPIYVSVNETIGAILKKREEKGYSFHSFLVVGNSGKLVGILTENDFAFCDDFSLTADRVMSKELITGKESTSLDEAYRTMKERKKKLLPLINSSGEIAGLYIFSDLKRIKEKSSPLNNTDANGQLVVAAAIGIGDDAFERIELLRNKVNAFVIDTAHGDSKLVIDTAKEIKRKYGELEIVIGNVSEPESTKRLLDAGIDGIKVGQGPGSICTTRIIAGIGCPQVTAVYNCSKIADQYSIPVCSDGGIRFSGDIPIALGAGAQSVMLGGVLAGTDEAPGETVFLKGRKWKTYRGMGSVAAMTESESARERYRQTDTGKKQLIPEGIEGLVEYKGQLSDIIFQLVGGLRRGMGYVGAADIQELREKADFWRISSAGQAESHPHDVHIIKEAPNYAWKGDKDAFE